MQYKCAIASMSLGRAWVHDLPGKLDQAAEHQFQGVEIFYEDLEYFAKSLSGAVNDNSILEAVANVRKMCNDRHIEIIGLQPFMHYEGLLDSEEHKKRITKLHLWFKIAKALGTDIIQIPTNFLTEGISGDREVIVADMREVADLGAKEMPVIRFAYENLCWGRFIDTWEGAWDIVAAVDRPNFGMCLDAFHIAGREWGDPARENGMVEGDADVILKQSLEKMVRTTDVERVFYVQVADAERMRSPLVKGHAFHVDEQPARMSWSRNARLFPFEHEGYLPVLDVLKAITEPGGLGFRGWVSMELFSRTMAEPGPEVPEEHAKRAMASWKKLVEEMKW